MLDSATLAGLSGIVDTSLDQFANLYYYGPGVQDDTGGTSAGYSDTPDVTEVPCSVRPDPSIFQGNRLIGAQEQQETLWLLRFSRGRVVPPKTHVKVGTAVYEVVGAAGPEQSFNVNTIVRAMELRT